MGGSDFELGLFYITDNITLTNNTPIHHTNIHKYSLRDEVASSTPSLIMLWKNQTADYNYPCEHT